VRAEAAAVFRRREDGVDTLAGVLDRVSAPAVFEAGRKLWASRPRPSDLRLDLSGLERVDSAALATLVAWKGWARARGLRLVYLGAPPALAALARLSGIGDLLGEVPGPN
jgi:anti-anti-sigma factor